MARRVGSPIRRGSHWPMAEKTVILFQCHYASMMKLFESSNRPFKTRGLGEKKSSGQSSDSINK
jgi:hypothetical protein